MEIEMNLKERLVLLGILPRKGDFLSLKLVMDLDNKIGFKAEDFEKYKITQNEHGILWNEEGSKAVFKYDLLAKEIELISKSLEELNGKNELTFDHFSLYEKIVGGKK